MSFLLKTQNSKLITRNSVKPAHGDDDANGTGGNVVNLERVGSNRKEMAMIGVLLVICIVPTTGGADLKN